MILTALRMLWPYLLAASVAWGAAWHIQGLRLAAAELETERLHLTVQQIHQRRAAAALRINEETTNAWLQNLDALHAYYRQHPVVRLLPATDAAGGLRVPVAPGGSDAGAPEPLPGPRVVAALEDCGVTTLQLLQLQGWIRSIAKETADAAVRP